MIATLRKLGIAVANLMAGSAIYWVFVMVADELRNVDLYYCPSVGVDKCTYPYPLLGTFHIWDAWTIDFGFICLGAALIAVGSIFLGMVISELG
jgi:hypothetical protein